MEREELKHPKVLYYARSVFAEDCGRFPEWTPTLREALLSWLRARRGLGDQRR